MKKLLVILASVLIASSSFAAEVKVLGVIVNGTISATGSYYAFGGENPFYENQYRSEYYAKGTAGLGMTSAFSGAISTQEQLEVQTGYGKFLTKAGTGTLINSKNEDSGTITGTLIENAVGFAGFVKEGIITTGFSTASGLIGIADAKGTGSFQSGAVQQITTGTSVQGSEPKTTERAEFHFAIGPGQFQTTVQFAFPK